MDMDTRISRLLIVISATVALAACSSASAPTWTFPPPAAGAAAAAGPTASAATEPAASSGGQATAASAVEIHAFDLGFKPAQASVAAPGPVAVTFVNDGATVHNITFADGTALTADPGKTTTGTVTVPAGGLTFLCSIPGHADAGMKGSIAVAGNAMPGMSMAPMGSPTTPAATAPVADPNAPKYTLVDATAPAVMPGTVHDVDFPIIEKDMTVADGFVVHVWTFGGTVPGPTLRVHLGDTVNVHLTNQTTMSHSIDFHASQTAMNDQMVEIKPGATFTYSFTADYAGVWMYHCGTAPALDHIANGMFGMVIVEPKGGLPKVDKEVAIVQNEWYLGAQKQPIDYTKADAAAPAPDFVTFNGVANQYKDNPIAVPTDGRVRVFVLDAGPNIDSSFHVVGTIFDTVTKEGIQLVKGNSGGWGSQAVDLSPAQGAIIEFSPKEDGMYPMVTHAFNFFDKGAVGIFMAGDGDPKN
ncbi:MAG TPA: multicopper oxidase domain-containing protein [Candidatus Limnocylindrales bacterium]|jgi:nitrite reductase (NO-forming)|nr:multicopper oxidase domain-containing protein [Candidatus Limnocylindrales bacterium]